MTGWSFCRGCRLACTLRILEFLAFHGACPWSPGAPSWFQLPESLGWTSCHIPDRTSVAGVLWCIGAYEWCCSSCSALSGGCDYSRGSDRERVSACSRVFSSARDILLWGRSSNVQERALEILVGVRVWKAVNFVFADGACGRLY